MRERDVRDRCARRRRRHLRRPLARSARRSGSGADGAARRARRRARAGGGLRRLARLADRAADPPPGARALALDHAAAARVQPLRAAARPRLHDVRAQLRRVGARGDQRRRRERRRWAWSSGSRSDSGARCRCCGSLRGSAPQRGDRALERARARAAHVARHAPPGRDRPRRLRGAARRLERARRADSPVATDPSADGALLRVAAASAARGVLRTRHGDAVPLPGASRRSAARTWRGSRRRRDRDRARRSVTARRRRIPLPPHATVDALAISGEWLVVRDAGDSGIANLFAVSLARSRAPPLPRGLGDPRRDRPADDRGRRGRLQPTRRARASAIYEVDLATGARARAARRRRATCSTRTRRSSTGRLLYERTDRCAQELLLGSPRTPGVRSRAADAALDGDSRPGLAARLHPRLQQREPVPEPRARRGRHDHARRDGARGDRGLRQRVSADLAQHADRQRVPLG